MLVLSHWNFTFSHTLELGIVLYALVRRFVKEGYEIVVLRNVRTFSAGVLPLTDLSLMQLQV